MISPRVAFVVGRIHRWLGLIVGVQVVIWTASGLFFTLFPMSEVKGEHLWKPPAEQAVPLSEVRIPLELALQSVAEDRPIKASLRWLGDRPVYEIRGEIGVFLVSATDGVILSPLTEDVARSLATSAWVGKGPLKSMDYLESAPPESRGKGPVWAARFEGKGHPTLYIWPNTGEVGPVRTDLWRTYDLLWGLHIMNYDERENFHHPLIIAAAVLGVSLSLFGITLVLQRFLRPRT